MSILRASEIYAVIFCRLLENGIPQEHAIKLSVYMSMHKPTADLIRQHKEQIIEILAADVSESYRRIHELLGDFNVVPVDIIIAGINTYRERKQLLGY